MTDTPWKPNHRITAGFFLTSAAGLLLIIILNIFLNEPSESALLFGLSAERLVLLGGMLILFIGLTYLGLQILRGKSFKFASSEPTGKPSRSMNFILGVTVLVFLSAWLMTWTPAERFATLYYYIVRVYPFIVWLTCVSGAGLILLLANRFGAQTGQVKAFVQEQRVSFLIAGAALLIFGLISWAVSFRVVGMGWQEEDYWYGAGVPLLPFQVLLAAIASIALVIVANKFFFAEKFGKKRWPDLILFLVIWIIAAWLWAQEPVNSDFFITEPAAPNYEHYPDYDARFFDLVSQYALIGQGLNNDNFYDRPLYSALLVYLHVFGKQDYDQIAALQAALFAIFPALAYLLGKRLHSRAAGAGLAILFTLRGMNAVEAGPFINIAHQKQMLTDFPSAILMLILTILLVRWLQEPEKNWLSIGLAGGITGLATLLRPHPLIFVPILIALTIRVYRQKPRLWIPFSALFLAAALAGILPWLQSNGQGTSIVDMYLGRVKDVIQQRYPDFQLPWDSMLPAPSTVTTIDNSNAQFSRTAAPTAAPTIAPLPAPTAAPLPDKSILAFSIDNFLNNLTMSVLILPDKPHYQDLQYTIRKSENFWKPYWDGTMSPWAKTLLPINLILIALGLGTAWKRARLSGFIPLMVMLAYYVMNALARTSGGRYLVPVDWVVIVYYFLGILTLIEMVSAFFCSNFFVQAISSPKLQTAILLNRITWAKFLGVVLLFTVIGTLIPLSGSFFEQRYSPLSKKELGQQFAALAGNQAGISSEELNTFLSAPGSVILQGRILYPRQFSKDEGPKRSVYYFYRRKPYPRMLLTLIGPNGETPVILPSLQALPIPNASDAIILGCRENIDAPAWAYVQVWAVFLTHNNILLKRTPSIPLACPLPEPVCDNNRNCK